MADARTNALKKVWWIERDAIAIATTSETDSSTDYLSVTEVKTVNVHAVKKDENFVATGTGITMSESPAIPEEFHEALADYAISKGYEFNPQTIPMAQYFDSKWKMCIREGKRYANKNRDGSGYHIKQHDF